ncbi:hypothetical protein Hdeb2414_s0022g00617571 [Helianthus debilis subsp. tardiflorus]
MVGRTVDLATLVDFDRLLKIAGTIYSKIQYLVGLSILISFYDEIAADKFLNSRNIWGPWFSKLAAWGGQSFPLERVAWLRVHGIPLHLLELDVLKMVGELFSKVLYVPNLIEEDKDLSVFRAEVLAWEDKRIKENVRIVWKNKSFRVWVEKQQEEWIPDCLGFNDVVPPDGSSPMMSSSVIRKEDSENVEDEGLSRSDDPVDVFEPVGSGFEEGGVSGSGFWEDPKRPGFSFFEEGLSSKIDGVKND